MQSIWSQGGAHRVSPVPASLRISSMSKQYETWRNSNLASNIAEACRDEDILDTRVANCPPGESLKDEINF